MKTTQKIVSVLTLLALLSLTVATPVLAFDGRSGQKVVIKADEVVNDDLYVTANEFVLDGIVKGDVIVFGTMITINGTVEGDLIAAGQTVVINGTVTDDARIAGAALQINQDASVGSDVVSAGASLETKEGSKIDGELVYAGAQGLLAGNVAGDAQIATGALALNGEFGGDVKAEVGEPNTGGNPSPSMYMPQTGVSIPTVPAGLTIAKGARINGNLEYTQSKDIEFPSGSILGKVVRNQPVAGSEAIKVKPTPAQKAINWSLDLMRSTVTLLLFGLLLGWLVPTFIKGLMEKLQGKPAESLGWGVVAYAAFFFVILLLVIVMIIGGVIFGALTLRGISGTIIWVGLLAIFELILGFVLVTSFLTKILVGWLSGKWIINRINPALVDHTLWPLLLGVFVVALAVALPFIGWLFGLVVMLLGLGALWIWGRDLWQSRKIA